jgi:hypothetical protein
MGLPGFGGTVLYPGDAGYDEARTVFNGMIDRRPVLIARCSTARDVGAAVGFARDRGVPLSVYGGGHGVTGSAVCDGGICVDLRPMKAVDIDVEALTVRAEAGLTWGELDAATQAYGLAVTGGRVSTTGIGGLTLGSGSGWLERKLGFTCDNLIRAEVVTADGSQLDASDADNPDLFWALRGGGGNFGIVTAYHFRLHPIGPVVLGGLLMYPAAAGRALVRFWRDFMMEAPDELGTALAFTSHPTSRSFLNPSGASLRSASWCVMRAMSTKDVTCSILWSPSTPGSSTLFDRCTTWKSSSSWTRTTRKGCSTTGAGTSSPPCPMRRSIRSLPGRRGPCRHSPR